MTIGKKRSRVVKGGKIGGDGSKAVVHKRQRVGKGSKAGVEVSKASVGSTHTNPYLFFLDAYQKKAKAANKSPSVANQLWNNGTRCQTWKKRHMWIWPTKEKLA